MLKGVSSARITLHTQRERRFKNSVIRFDLRDVKRESHSAASVARETIQFQRISPFSPSADLSGDRKKPYSVSVLAHLPRDSASGDVSERTSAFSSHVLAASLRLRTHTAVARKTNGKNERQTADCQHMLCAV